MLLFAWLAPSWLVKSGVATEWMLMSICSVNNKPNLNEQQSLGAPLTSEKKAHTSQHCTYCSWQTQNPFLPQTKLMAPAAFQHAERIRLGSNGRTIVAKVSARAHLSRAPPIYS